MMDEHASHKSSPALIVAAWLLVVVPTGWGLTYTVQNALKIFKGNAPVIATPAPSPAVSPAAQH